MHRRASTEIFADRYDIAVVPARNCKVSERGTGNNTLDTRYSDSVGSPRLKAASPNLPP